MSHLTFKYKVEAMDYIVKCGTKDFSRRLEECIETIFLRRLTLNSPKGYQVKIGRKFHYIPFDEIVFFESDTSIRGGGKIILHTKNSTIEFYGTLSDIGESHSDFFRCHQSYIINLKNVTSINSAKKEAIMSNGEIVFIATRKRKELIKHLGV
jgi:two-component system response regulator AgrA